MLRVGGKQLQMNAKTAPWELDRHLKVYRAHDCSDANVDPEIPWMQVFIFKEKALTLNIFPKVFSWLKTKQQYIFLKMYL